MSILLHNVKCFGFAFQGKHVVDACKDNHIKHLVFSGLKSAKEHIKKSGCDHFESKKSIHDCIVKRGLRGKFFYYHLP